WARRAGLDENDAPDLVQDTLTLLVQKLPEFNYEPDKSFRAWLKSVLMNKLRERRRRKDPLAGADSSVETLESAEDLDQIEEDEYRRFTTRRALESIQSEFSEVAWRAFNEHVVNGRDAAEVARDLQVQLGTVYAAKSRILARIREKVQEA